PVSGPLSWAAGRPRVAGEITRRPSPLTRLLARGSSRPGTSGGVWGRGGDGPVMVMAGCVKPAKVTVKVKLATVMLPGRTTGVQFGFGQVARAWKSASLGGGAVSGLMVSRPFFGDSSPLLVDTVVDWVCDSTGLFGFLPGLKQSTIAVSVTLSVAVALVLPT